MLDTQRVLSVSILVAALLIIFWLVSAYFASSMLANKGRSSLLGALLGLLLGPIGVLIAAAIPMDPNAVSHVAEDSGAVEHQIVYAGINYTPIAFIGVLILMGVVGGMAYERYQHFTARDIEAEIRVAGWCGGEASLRGYNDDFDCLGWANRFIAEHPEIVRFCRQRSIVSGTFTEDRFYDCMDWRADAYLP